MNTDNLVLCGTGLLVPGFKELQIEAAVWEHTFCQYHGLQSGIPVYDIVRRTQVIQ